MKKSIVIAFLSLVSILVNGCGNSWEVTKKTFHSNFGDMPRVVEVRNSRTDRIIWQYTGPVYVTEGSGPGNITLVCRDKNGKLLKHDFIGNDIEFVMFEAVK